MQYCLHYLQVHCRKSVIFDNKKLYLQKIGWCDNFEHELSTGQLTGNLNYKSKYLKADSIVIQSEEVVKLFYKL